METQETFLLDFEPVQHNVVSKKWMMVWLIISLFYAYINLSKFIAAINNLTPNNYTTHVQLFAKLVAAVIVLFVLPVIAFCLSLILSLFPYKQIPYSKKYPQLTVLLMAVIQFSFYVFMEFFSTLL